MSASIPDPATAPVLVLAPTGRDGPASAGLLRRSGLTAQVCADLQQLIDGLMAGADAALIAEEALLKGPIGDLIAWVGQQPPWSDMPFVVLTSHRALLAVLAWRSRLVESLGNVSLLERPIQ